MYHSVFEIPRLLLTVNTLGNKVSAPLGFYLQAVDTGFLRSTCTATDHWKTSVCFYAT